jgi:hypothetical protein
LTLETRQKVREKKIPYWLKNSIKKFSITIFLLPFLLAANNFSPNFKLNSNRPLHTNAWCQKIVGVLGGLFKTIQP